MTLKTIINSLFVSPEIAEQRLSICKECENLNSLGLCNFCHCVMAVKTKLKNDITGNVVRCADPENAKW